jgi:hypothetical protein
MASQRSEFPAASDSRGFADLCSQAFHTTSSLNDVCRCELARNGGSLASQDDCHRQMWAKPRAPQGKAEWPLAQRWPRSTAFSDCCVMGLASAIDLCHSAPSSLQQPLILISAVIIILNLREFYIILLVVFSIERV